MTKTSTCLYLYIYSQAKIFPIAGRRFVFTFLKEQDGEQDNLDCLAC